jgi:iron complex transport system substrate-binding protein
MAARHQIACVMAVVALTATACGSSTPAAEQSPYSLAAGEQKTEYPLTFSNCGKDYTFAKAPSRVAVMNGGSVAEVSSLLELGLGDRIVANAQKYGASEVAGRVDAIKNLPTGGVALNNLQDIPRESMLGLRPDFVISTYDGGFSADSGFATREDLLKASANSYAPAASCGDAFSVTGTPTIEDSYTMLRDFGEIFDVPARADKVIADSETRIADIEAKVADQPVKKVMIVFSGMGAEDLNSVAGNGIWNDILAKAGAVNAFAGEEVFISLSKEKAAAAAVDALIVVNYMNPDPQANVQAMFKLFPQWQAAKDDVSLVLSDSVYLGPSNDLAVEKIAKLVHPEVF